MNSFLLNMSHENQTLSASVRDLLSSVWLVDSCNSNVGFMKPHPRQSEQRVKHRPSKYWSLGTILFVTIAPSIREYPEMTSAVSAVRMAQKDAWILTFWFFTVKQSQMHTRDKFQKFLDVNYLGRIFTYRESLKGGPHSPGCVKMR